MKELPFFFFFFWFLFFLSHTFLFCSGPMSISYRALCARFIICVVPICLSIADRVKVEGEQKTMMGWSVLTSR